ncbi:MAG: SPOR domain-containing protein [Mariprofundaceae bacterium]|nr:SPOR domain-containing protein [Mariprofundaceae bacterium]
MSDNKDKDATESPVEFDFDSTVELDISKFVNVAPNSTDELPFDEETSIDGLMEIYEHLKKDGTPAIEPDSIHEQDPSHDTVSFDALSADFEDIPDPVEEADENLLGGEYLPETATTREESDDIFNLDISDLPDEDTGDEDELLAGNANPATGEQPPLESPDDDEEFRPLIELTEEMRYRPEDTDDQAVPDMADDPDAPELTTRENDLLSEAVSDFAEKNSGIDKTITNNAETPELTTREINVISAATETTGNIDGEEEIPEIEVEAVFPPQSDTAAAGVAEEPAMDPAAASGGGRSNTIPLLFAVLGIAAGGFGAWMAFDATGRVADLERRIQHLSAANNDSQSHDIADIRQRLDKIERRLTGTPTIEAAAPLGAEPATVQGAAVEPVEEAVLQSEPITPQTPVSSAPPNGDWVVNISSHAKEDLAIRENARLQSLGLNTEIHTARIKERTWYRVQITGFASKDEAKAKLMDLQKYPDIKGAWIGKK